MTLQFLAASLEALDVPLVLVDTDHVIMFVNEAGAKQYAKWGGRELVGKSLLDCHNEDSCRQIEQVLAALRNGDNDVLISENEKRRSYMRAIRSEDGALLGYYERYEALNGV